MIDPNRPLAALLLPLILMAAASSSRSAMAQAESRIPQITLAGQVVDEGGQPAPGAVVQGRFGRLESRSRAGLDGRFFLAIPDIALSSSGSFGFGFGLMAKTDDGRIGLFESQRSLTVGAVRIVVAKPRTVQVRAVDAAGKPVAGSLVSASAGRSVVSEGVTGPDGTLAIQIPDGPIRCSVAARGPGLGLTYFENQARFGGRNRGTPIKPLPDSLSLTLEPARPPLRFKAVDDQGVPLAGLDLTLRIDRIAGVNVFTDLGRLTRIQTDREGLAIFDGIPARAEGNVSITTESDDYQQRGISTVAEPTPGEQTLVHIRLGRIAGRVLMADGRPAAGAKVRATGFGKGAPFTGGMPSATTTDRDGRYSMPANSELAYAVDAARDDLIALAGAPAIVRPGQVAEAPEMVLRPGTMLYGRVTAGRDANPSPRQLLDAAYDLGTLPAEIRDPTAPLEPRVRLRFRDTTDPTGQYRILLAPGKYDVKGPGRLPIETITIPASLAGDPAEFLRDYHLP